MGRAYPRLGGAMGVAMLMAGILCFTHMVAAAVAEPIGVHTLYHRKGIPLGWHILGEPSPSEHGNAEINCLLLRS